ncbi:MAG: lysostaphin resistance A-like protein, partial [Promethearchaeota archaeon]
MSDTWDDTLDTDEVLSKIRLDKSARRDALVLFFIVLGATTIIVALQYFLLAFIDYIPLPFLDSFWKRMLLNISAYVALIVILVVFFFGYERPSLESLGLTKWQLPLVLGFGFLTTVGFPIVILVSAPIILSFFPLPSLSSPDFIIMVVDLALIVVFLVLVAIFEELVFRGYIFHKLRQGYTGFLPFILTALLFALLHLPKYIIAMVTTVPFDPFYALEPAIAIPVVFMSGLTFSAIRYHTGSIVVPMFTHFFWNFYIIVFQPVLEAVSMEFMIPVLAVLTATIAMHVSFHSSWPISRALFPQPPESVDDYLLGFVTRSEKFHIKAKRMQSLRSFTEGDPSTIQPVEYIEGGEEARGEPRTRFVSLSESIRYRRRQVRYTYFRRLALWYHKAALLLAENRDQTIIPSLRGITKQVRLLYKLEAKLAILAGRLDYYLERQEATGIPISSIHSLQRTYKRYHTR